MLPASAVRRLGERGFPSFTEGASYRVCHSARAHSFSWQKVGLGTFLPGQPVRAACAGAGLAHVTGELWGRPPTTAECAANAASLKPPHPRSGLAGSLLVLLITVANELAPAEWEREMCWSQKPSELPAAPSREDQLQRGPGSNVPPGK